VDLAPVADELRRGALPSSYNALGLMTSNEGVATEIHHASFDEGATQFPSESTERRRQQLALYRFRHTVGSQEWRPGRVPLADRVVTARSG